MIDGVVDEISKGLEGWKEIDRLREESGISEHFKEIKYADREEDEEMKQIYDEEQQKFGDIPSKLEGRVDGEITMDLHGNMDISHTKKKEKVETGL
jgi:hypothetical protein